MVNTIPMHMVNGLENLVHHLFDPRLWQRSPLSFDGFVHVHFHQLEDQSQSSCRLIVEHLEQGDDIGMGRKPLERLDFSQVINLSKKIIGKEEGISTYFFDVEEIGFHALNCHLLIVFDGLSL